MTEPKTAVKTNARIEELEERIFNIEAEMGELSDVDIRFGCIDRAISAMYKESLPTDTRSIMTLAKDFYNFVSQPK